MSGAKIQDEAREILGKFSRALAKVKVKPKALKREIGGFRVERDGEKSDEDFRKLMFANAPHVEGDFLISTKKKWSEQ